MGLVNFEVKRNFWKAISCLLIKFMMEFILKKVFAVALYLKSAHATTNIASPIFSQNEMPLDKANPPKENSAPDD